MFISAFSYLIGLQITVATWQGKLKFNTEGQFKILQLTDLHFGEDLNADMRTIGLMFKLITVAQADLVVLSGDMFTGETPLCKEVVPGQCYLYGWRNYTTALRSIGQKYAIILGNHDTTADLDRREIIDLDMSSEFSLTQQSPEGVGDGTNYYLPIYNEEGQSIETVIWMFDSHEDGCLGQESRWGCVEKDQIQWFNNKYDELSRITNNSILQSISFVHIPPPEYVTLYNEFQVQGYMGETVCCPCQNSGYVDALIRNNVIANYVGHDHNNDFSGFFVKNNYTIELLYGWKTGYGNYGPMPNKRGGSLITIQNKQNGQINVDQYFLNEMGDIVPKAEYENKKDKSLNCPCPDTDILVILEYIFLVILVIFIVTSSFFIIRSQILGKLQHKEKIDLRQFSQISNNSFQAIDHFIKEQHPNVIDL